MVTTSGAGSNPGPVDIGPVVDMPNALRLSDLATRSGFSAPNLPTPLGGADEAPPTHAYSATLLVNLWPMLSTHEWYLTSQAQKETAKTQRDAAAHIRAQADWIDANQSGEFAEAMYRTWIEDAMAVELHADMWEAFSGATAEVAGLIDFLRERLRRIDLDAHEQIETARRQARMMGPVLGPPAFGTMLAEILAEARTEAETTAGEVNVGLQEQLTIVLDAPGPDKMQRQPLPERLKFGTTERPANKEPGEDEPRAPAQDLLPAESPGVDRLPVDSGNDADTTPGIGESILPGISFEGADAPAAPSTDRIGNEGLGSLPVSPSLIPGLGSAAGTPLAPSMGSLGSLPSTPGVKMPTVGSPLSGLTSSMSSFASPGVGNVGAPLNGAPQQFATGLTNPGSDFARGMSAGLTAGVSTSSPWVPPSDPVGPSSPPVGPAAQPASLSGASPAPVAAASAPVSTQAPAPGAVATSMVAPPMSSAGLAPYGSDVARGVPMSAAAAAAVPAGAAVSSSSSPAPALPAGAVGPAVGVAAGAGAAAALRPIDDPLLQLAVQQVYELLHASRLHLGLEWCVGVFQTPTGTDVVVVSNEGSGFVPAGVFVPRSVRTLFEDPLLGKRFREAWFGWVNPAETMVAYGDYLAQHGVNRQLYALAVSTELGGSAAPAQRAGVPHYQECSLMTSPIPASDPAAGLDANRQHRLELVDPHQYLRLGESASRATMAEFWRLTTHSVRWGLEQASAVAGVDIDPLVWNMFRAMERSAAPEEFSDAEWLQLDAVVSLTTSTASAMQPGRMDAVTQASPLYHGLQNVARVGEVLGYWRAASFLEVAYVVTQIDSSRALLAHGM